MRLASLLLIAACGTSPPPDVVGPFTGPVHTFHVDSFTFPRTAMDARALGDDLDGDGKIDNHLGMSTASLADLGNDLTTHGSDMIAAGAIRSTFEIQADDLQEDPSAAVRYVGAPGEDAVAVGGTFAAGAFISNRTARSHNLGQATLHLPIFEDADPIVLDLNAMEIDLAPDATGYSARVRGLAGRQIMQLAASALSQMIAANPSDHADLVQILDGARTGKLDADSIAQSQILISLLQPDTERDAIGYVSFGFALHLSPDDPAGTPMDLCHDRVLDGVERDVDCGASCLPCAGGRACGSGGDCQSGACAGTCAAVSCSDGVRDGLESDVDCGGWECRPCTTGHHCVNGGDCQSMNCLSSGLCAGVM